MHLWIINGNRQLIIVLLIKKSCLTHFLGWDIRISVNTSFDMTFYSYLIIYKFKYWQTKQ